MEPCGQDIRRIRCLILCSFLARFGCLAASFHGLLVQARPREGTGHPAERSLNYTSVGRKSTNSVDIHGIESRLLQHLGIPEWRGPSSVPETEVLARVQLGRLRILLDELRVCADQIGKIPDNYPRHVHIVMRIISALLPWYTRPLSQFGQKVSETLEAVASSLGQQIERAESSSIPAPPVLPPSENGFVTHADRRLGH